MRPAGKGGEKEEVEEEAASPLQGRESRDVANKPLNMKKLTYTQPNRCGYIYGSKGRMQAK